MEWICVVFILHFTLNSNTIIIYVMKMLLT